MKTRITGAVLALSLLAAFAGTARAEDAQAGKLFLNVGVKETAALENLKHVRADAFATDRVHVVQLDGPLTKERAESLRDAGVVLGEYLPSYAYVVDLKGVAPNAINQLPFITWIGEFQSAWKLDPELGTRAHLTQERQELAAQGMTPILVTMFAGHGTSKAVDAINAMRGNKIHFIEDEGGTFVISATVPSAEVARLALITDVHYVEEAPEITDRNATTRWIIQTNVLDSTTVWANGLTGAGQIVGHMDGKVNQSHCAFIDPVNPIGPLHRKIVAYNTTAGYNQHGTHTADTSVGEDINGSTGNVRGMAYGGKLVHSPTPAFSDTGFYNAANTQFGQGARVFTNSWGNDGTTNYDGLCRGIDRISYDQEEALVCFAVTNLSALKNPENAKNVLAVGNSNDTPTQGNFCTGGAGPTVDGRRKPEIWAPGCNTTSASGSGSVCTTAQLTGTSMACPAVAGAGLLVRQYYMNGYYPTGAANVPDGFTPSGALIKATLLNGTVDMTAAGYPGVREGWGRLLLENSLYFSGNARKLVVPADIRNADGMSTGQQQEYSINVNGSTEPLKITLVWTDKEASASVGSGNPVINDLDLEVVTPSSTLYLGNQITNGISTVGGTKDAKNNVEMVMLNSPPLGQWTVRVKAAAVNFGLQGFALVVTGDVSDQAAAPILNSITPDSGESGSIVAITDLDGANFQLSGTTTVKLTMIGQPDIVASGTSVVTADRVTCNFDLTAAEPGNWDVVLTNPDSQTATLPGAFRVSLTCIRGDVNRDGLVDGGDIARFSEIVVNGGAIPVERCAGDLENAPNNLVDEPDVSNFVDCILAGGCP